MGTDRTAATMLITGIASIKFLQVSRSDMPTPSGLSMDVLQSMTHRATHGMAMSGVYATKMRNDSSQRRCRGCGSSLLSRGYGPEAL